jgi:hypothetical protein
MQPGIECPGRQTNPFIKPLLLKKHGALPRPETSNLDDEWKLRFGQRIAGSKPASQFGPNCARQNLWTVQCAASCNSRRTRARWFFRACSSWTKAPDEWRCIPRLHSISLNVSRLRLKDENGIDFDFEINLGPFDLWGSLNFYWIK